MLVLEKKRLFVVLEKSMILQKETKSNTDNLTPLNFMVNRNKGSFYEQ